MKKFLSALVASSLLISAVPALADDSISVSVNGKQIDFANYDNVMPYIEDDFTLIPIRAIAENLGLQVDWNEETRTVTAKREGNEIVLVIDSKNATVNGEVKELDIPARITEDRTFVPLRFVSENMGVSVDWDGETRVVTITDGNSMSYNEGIDNTKWQYNAENDVYWQTGIQYCKKSCRYSL